MPEDNENEKEKKPDLALPCVCGAFVGRDREIAEIMAFLEEQSATACSIMLIYGPRGVGKSALAYEVSRRSYYERGIFETVVWLDRTRASELLLLNHRRFPLSDEDIALNPDVPRDAETYRYWQRFASKREYASAEECAAWKRQLGVKNDNLLLLEERLSHFVMDTDSGNIQFVKQKRRLEREIAELEERLATRCEEINRNTLSSNGLPKGSVSFLGEILQNRFLLVIDDFDEYENLGGDAYGLCEQLARVRPPKKVILTTRLLKHSFAEHVFQTLPLGLLSKDDVKGLSLQCGLDALKPIQLVNCNLDDTADYLWEKSGGLPEFVTRFFMPLAQQRGWLAGRNPGWQGAFEHFTVEYLGGREQKRLLAKYEEDYDVNKAECAKEFVALSDEEKCILISLALQGETQALKEADLAHSVGYRLNTKDFNAFYTALTYLIEKRLIVPWIEREERQGEIKQSRGRTVWKYMLLPFTRQFIKDQLLAAPEVEAHLFRMQTDRWIKFVEGYIESPREIKQQLANICMAHVGE